MSAAEEMLALALTVPLLAAIWLLALACYMEARSGTIAPLVALGALWQWLRRKARRLCSALLR